MPQNLIDTNRFTQQSKGQLMALGQFVFEIPALVYEELNRQNSWRHPSADPVGAPPRYQFTGAGAETIQLTGTIYRELSNPKKLDTLREMAGIGEAYVLVDGSGNVFGFYVIESLSEKQSYIDANGRPKRVEFDLQLTKTDTAPEVDDTQNTTDDASI